MWVMATIELRGPCNHLAAKLDTERKVIERKCPQCSQERGGPVFHYFDAQSGSGLAELEREERVEARDVDAASAVDGNAFRIP